MRSFQRSKFYIRDALKVQQERMSQTA